ncbi:MAG: hypothetical protein ACREX3_11685, partial [Gammaproteobacteria bacterium]
MAVIDRTRRRWLLHHAPYFFVKTASLLSAPEYAPRFHSYPKLRGGLLIRDQIACTWVRRLVGELVATCEHARVNS